MHIWQLNIRTMLQDSQTLAVAEVVATFVIENAVTFAHNCGILFQLSAYFPIMPVMMKPVRVGRIDPQPQHRSIPAPSQPPDSGTIPNFSNCPPKPELVTESECKTSEPSQTKPALFAYTICHSQFLTPVGFEKHMHLYARSAVPDDVTSHRALKAPRLDTVNAVLARPAGDIPCPPKSFRYPLYQEHIRKKGLARHLRKNHQIDKPPFFDFQPSRDMHPDRFE